MGGEAEVIGGLLQYGVLGLVLLALIIGWLEPGRACEREKERADRLEVENREIRNRLEQDVIPLLTRAIIALEHQASRPSDAGR